VTAGNDAAASVGTSNATTPDSGDTGAGGSAVRPEPARPPLVGEVTPAAGSEGVLTWDQAGVVAAGSNPFDLQGGWWKSQDCGDVAAAVAAGSFVCPANAPTPACCTQWDASRVGPDNEPGWTVTSGLGAPSSGRVCIKGTAAQVLDGVDGLPAYGAVWGSSLSLALNGFSGFDATKSFPGGPIRGFRLDLAGSVSGVLRIGLTMPDNFDAHFKEFAAPALDTTILFDELEQGSWVAAPVPLDLSNLLALDIHVTVGPEAATPFALCVSNVRVLQ